MMKFYRIVLSLLLVAGGCTSANMQPTPGEFGEFASREDFLQRLEPRGDRILHGAGPTPEDFADYWEELERTPPVLYTAYFDLLFLRDDWPFFLRDVLDRYPAYVIPQIALSMSQEGEAYEQLVVQGELDQQIDIFCWGLRQLGRPAFVRIGYGFNSPLTGYRPEPYRQAFVRIAEAIRIRHNLENVATVWCYAADSPTADYLDYYPGDQYVDWWGIDLFNPAGFHSTSTLAFVETARERGFPVMIGEAAPRGLGVDPDSRSWQRWFAPFFRFIYAHPSVKAFCYISWFQGDTRIEGDYGVLQRYQDELDNDYYLHATSPEELRWQLEWEE